MSWLKKLTSGLSKTSAKVTASLSSLLGRPAIDAASIEEVEDALIAADLGTRVAARLAEGVRRHKFDGEVTAPALAAALADGITEILDPGRDAAGHRSGEAPACRASGRRQRIGQDDDRGQAGTAMAPAGQERDAGRR